MNKKLTLEKLIENRVFGRYSLYVQIPTPQGDAIVEVARATSFAPKTKGMTVEIIEQRAGEVVFKFADEGLVDGHSFDMQLGNDNYIEHFCKRTGISLAQFFGVSKCNAKFVCCDAILPSGMNIDCDRMDASNCLVIADNVKIHCEMSLDIKSVEHIGNNVSIFVLNGGLAMPRLKSIGMNVSIQAGGEIVSDFITANTTVFKYGKGLSVNSMFAIR